MLNDLKKEENQEIAFLSEGVHVRWGKKNVSFPWNSLQAVVILRQG